MINGARHAAFAALRAVNEEQAYSNLVLPSLLRRHQINSRDSAFATELVHGTLRLRGTYDAVIHSLSRHGIKALDPQVLDILRLGMHQILTMRVPTHAGVDTSVDLVRQTVGHKPAGLVNAILRRSAERTLLEWLTHVTAGLDASAAMSIRYSHPEWIVEALSQSLAHDRSQLVAFLDRNNQAPPVTLVARPGLCEPDELPGTPGSVSPYAMRMESGDPASVPAVRDGRAGVQDEGSQAVALAFAQAGSGQSQKAASERWLDLCAGPGGKAALLAAIAAKNGAGFVANEIQPHRAELVRKAVQQLPDVNVTEHDGRSGPWGEASFDRVLLDAPCTGLGALRRRPEARWRRTPADLEALVPLQRELLQRAIWLTRKGGVIGYATCSPHPAETTQIVESVDGVQVEHVQQWWPHVHDTDAMYLAILRRR